MTMNSFGRIDEGSLPSNANPLAFRRVPPQKLNDKPSTFGPIIFILLLLKLRRGQWSMKYVNLHFLHIF